MSAYFESIARRIQGTLFLVIGIAILGILILMILFGFYLRGSWRAQILNRDAAMLDALVDLSMQENASLSREEALYELAIEVSSLRGVLAFEVFDGDRDLVTVLPDEAMAHALAAIDFEAVTKGKLIGRFHPEVPLDLLYHDTELTKETVVIPVVEILLGVDEINFSSVGVVRFWLDGSSIAEEYGALDRNLIVQGLSIWTVVCLFILFLGAVARARLKKLTDDLEARSVELEAVNRNLELSARSAAVGAISGHLMHGLKNPLAGLRAYLKAQGDEAAGEAAQRMQQLVSDTLMMLKGAGREGAMMSLGEIKAMVESRVGRILSENGIHLEWMIDESIQLKARLSNIIVLVLENLIHNGSEIDQNEWIKIESMVNGNELIFKVRDGGSGIKNEVSAALFDPGVSDKENGTGLGLAISRQLARGVSGDLVLVESSSTGCCFELRLPREV